MNDSFKVTGKLFVTRTYHDGRVEHTEYTNNVVTNGKRLLTQFLANQKPSGITHMAVGTFQGAVTVGDSALYEEVYRKQINSAITATSPSAKCIIDCVFGEGEAVGALREAGLFNADGVMIARANINEDKGIYQNLTISWEITVS